MTKIYLISPPKIDLDNFVLQLELALRSKKIPVFQLRLKGYGDDEIIQIGKKILQICHQNQTLFILNDRLDLAFKIGADGVHLGGEDGNILNARKKAKENSLQNFIIGASCYDSRHMAAQACEEGADYVSFGAFFQSPTKNSKGKPTPEILSWCNEILDAPSVAIGGITPENCQPLIDAGTDFLAVISYVWDNKNGVEIAINKLSLMCN